MEVAATFVALHAVEAVGPVDTHHAHHGEVDAHTEAGAAFEGEGVKLADGLTAPASARIIKRRDNGALVELRIHEGRNRQVRRMLEAVGYPVLHLRRSALAFLDLQGLKPGQWRELSGSEIARLKQL